MFELVSATNGATGLLGAGVLFVLAALALRIFIFRTMGDDPAAAELLEDSFPIQADLLSWELWRKRTLIARHHRWKADLYFGLHVSAFVAVLGGILIKEFA